MEYLNPRRSACLIRRARAHEIEDIVAITLAAHLDYRDQYPPAVFDVYMNYLRDVAEVWDEAAAAVLVAELDGRVAGTVCFYADAKVEGLGLPDGWAGFGRLAVSPAMHGRGIGGMLVAECIDMAGARGVSTIGIHTASFLRTACRIYDQKGFRRCYEYDLPASKAWGVPEDFDIIAYRLDLPRSAYR